MLESQQGRAWIGLVCLMVASGVAQWVVAFRIFCSIAVILLIRESLGDAFEPPPVQEAVVRNDTCEHSPPVSPAGNGTATLQAGGRRRPDGKTAPGGRRHHMPL